MTPAPEILSLDDEQLVESQPRVRGLLLQRLELIWRQVESHLDPDLGVDPRWAEIGLRVIDRESRLYRLDKAREVVEEEEMYGAGVDRKALVLAQLSKLEERLTEPS